MLMRLNIKNSVLGLLSVGTCVRTYVYRPEVGGDLNLARIVLQFAVLYDTR